MKTLLDILVKSFLVKDYISVERDPINPAIHRLTIDKELTPRNIDHKTHTIKVEVKGSIRNPKSVVEVRFFCYKNETIYNVFSYISLMLLNKTSSADDYAKLLNLPEPKQFTLTRDPKTYYVDYDIRDGEVYIIQETTDGRRQTKKVGESFRGMCIQFEDKHPEKISILI